MTYKTVKIGNKKIGPKEQVFFVAEVGINYNHNLDIAKKMIDASIKAGADAVKFQTFRTKFRYPPTAGEYKLMGKKTSIYDLDKTLEIPYEWLIELRDYCDSHDIIFFSSVFDKTTANMLKKVGVRLFKIASYDLTNLPLLDYIAKKKKPIVFSTGGANLNEIDEAVQLFEKNKSDFIILHCVARYPASFSDSNLAVIQTLKQIYKVPVGFSDHSIFKNTKNYTKLDPYTVPVSAVKAGADMIEKHITLDRKMNGPDHAFAIKPTEMRLLIKKLKEARSDYLEGKGKIIDASLLGSALRRTYESEKYVRNFAYKCLFASKKIKKGGKFARDNIRVLRPGNLPRGLEPKFYDLLIKKAKASRNIKQWQPITWDDVL